ncbi:MAG: lysine biosynthesis protein LysW [Candidatus Dormibacteria bacterium]
MSAACPECDAGVTTTDDVEVGEIVQCPECAVDLEVTARDPVRLELAPAEEEDWGE